MHPSASTGKRKRLTRKVEAMGVAEKERNKGWDPVKMASCDMPSFFRALKPLSYDINNLTAQTGRIRQSLGDSNRILCQIRQKKIRSPTKEKNPHYVIPSILTESRKTSSPPITSTSTSTAPSTPNTKNPVAPISAPSRVGRSTTFMTNIETDGIYCTNNQRGRGKSIPRAYQKNSTHVPQMQQSPREYHIRSEACGGFRFGSCLTPRFFDNPRNNTRTRHEKTQSGDAKATHATASTASGSRGDGNNKKSEKSDNYNCSSNKQQDWNIDGDDTEWEAAIHVRVEEELAVRELHNAVGNKGKLKLLWLKFHPDKGPPSELPMRTRIFQRLMLEKERLRLNA